MEIWERYNELKKLMTEDELMELAHEILFWKVLPLSCKECGEDLSEGYRHISNYHRQMEAEKSVKN